MKNEKMKSKISFDDFLEKNRGGQVTIFIIIAIILVASVAAYFIFRGNLFQGAVPSSVEPVYNSFLSCVEEKVYTGVDILESQGGYIELPDFEAGSDYMPFSSQLNLLGNPIPYWYYVSGNNIEREQVPSRASMEEQLGKFIDDKITDCKFDDYYEQGFEISRGEPDARVSIENNDVEVNLIMDLSISKGEDTSLTKNHRLTINSNLGNLYDSAKKIYNQEQDKLFLENYAVDTLRLYAPVDGVELTCSPRTWIADDVFEKLQDAIETNTAVLKTQGDSKDYFKIDTGVSENVRFVNSKNWTYSFDVEPADGKLLIANPVGNQPGLGILGFCYVPYHFVYNVKYPVLVQISDGEETFQFPLAVVVQGNEPRKAFDATASEIGLSELCQYKNIPVAVNIYDSKLNRVEAEISYECFGTKCNIGETSGGYLKKEFPQCVNGYILAKSEGFSDAKYLYSTTSAGSVDIVLDKVYKENVELKVDGRISGKNAIITFTSDAGSKTIAYPGQKSVELTEGQYEIQVQVYANSSLNIEATTSQQCVDVPESGLSGLFGMTKQNCFDIEMPAQIISNALAGGGTQNHYILESDLQNSQTIEINAQSLATPKSLEELQNNYVLFEDKTLEVNFK